MTCAEFRWDCVAYIWVFTIINQFLWYPNTKCLKYRENTLLCNGAASVSQIIIITYNVTMRWCNVTWKIFLSQLLPQYSVIYLLGRLLLFPKWWNCLPLRTLFACSTKVTFWAFKVKYWSPSAMSIIIPTLKKGVRRAPSYTLIEQCHIN